MKAHLSRYIKAYFSSWWMPLAHYAVALALLVAFLVLGVHLCYAAALGLGVLLVTCLVVSALGMLVAACVHLYKKRKLEGLVNLIAFLCLFLFPAGLYYAVIALMFGR
jgi:hypothetical protein